MHTLDCHSLPCGEGQRTWSVGEQACRQSSAALHSGSFTHAKISGPQFLIILAIVRGPEALSASKLFTCMRLLTIEWIRNVRESP